MSCSTRRLVPPGWQALELAAAAGMTRSVDPSSAGPLAAVGAGAFLGWTEGLDWCCANLDEGRVLTGKREPPEVLAASAPALPGGGTDARRQMVFCTPGRAPNYLHSPAERVAVEDTTGAGDAFTGTFLARRLWGDAPEPALRAGLAAAAGW